MESCSHPIVTKSEEESLDFGETIVSVKSFFPFWIGILKFSEDTKLESSLFDVVMSAIITVIEKLDFTVKVMAKYPTSNYPCI